MIDATFVISSDIFSNTTFNGTISFASNVSDVEDADFTLTAVDGNGITGVTFTVTQQTPTTYSLNFTVPADTEGAFSVAATGMVLPDGETVEVGINATPAAPVITYDTSVAVAATWGTPVYQGGGTVEVPITFASNVVITSAGVFDFETVAPLTDADLIGLDASIAGTDTDWTLIVRLPDDVRGSLSIDIVGEVFKVDTHVFDVVTIAPLVLPFVTIIPTIDNYHVQPLVDGEHNDFKIAFNQKVTGLSLNDIVSVFEMVEIGANMPTPTPYGWGGSSPPVLETTEPEDLSTTEWELLDPAPAGVPITLANDFDENGLWHGNEYQYYLIRWDPVPVGIYGFNFILKENTVRGEFK